MKTLVWPDTHNRVKLLNSFLEKSGHLFEKRIFLGDYFDQWNDRPIDAHITAKFIKQLLKDPRNVLLEGNHDTAYRFDNDASYCSGYSLEKSRAINEVLSYDDWQKIKLFEFEQGFLCSHAGVHGHIFCHPIHGITLEGIKKDCDTAVDAMRSNIIHPVYADGMSNGGKARVGGITWLRWWDFMPIIGLNQIVGHTILHGKPEVSYARIKKSVYKGKESTVVENVKVTTEQFDRMPPKNGTLSSINFNIDTDNRYFIILEDGNPSIHLTLDYL